MKSTRKIKIFPIVNTIFFIFLISTMIIPLLNAFALSFSTDLNSMTPEIILWPSEWSVAGYKTLFGVIKLARPVINNTIVAVVGTALHVLLCIVTGYALAKKGFKFAKYYIVFILVTMMVPLQNIMIPTYILYKDLKLINKLSSIIVTGLITGYTVLLLRNFFMSLPPSLSESAYIDGASDLRILFQIFIPLSKAGIATVTLFQFVTKWNHFMEALLFLNSPKMYTLQISLRSILLENDASSANIVVLTKNTQMAGVVVAVIPLLILYPFLQKYFISGIMLGAVKG